MYNEVYTVTAHISTIELNSELTNLAYEMGLNVSKTCEIALKEAIRRL
jgi:post-segregation antitoxin (ccd killing protein)